MKSKAPIKFHSQTVEIVGRNWLISQLYRAGIEVARPERDHGIDLIAFLDLDKRKRFVAFPVQMKAAQKESFTVYKRFGNFPNLRLVYIWNLSGPEPSAYCLTYPEAEGVARQINWTRTLSWKTGASGNNRPGYSTSRPTPKLKALLAPYAMKSPDDWRKKMVKPLD